MRPRRQPAAARTGRAACAVRVGDEKGFVLTLVIFALAALSVGATAAFLIVQSESRMADGGVDTAHAFQLAQAGLARYAAETVGTDLDSAVYVMGGGTVVVRAEKVVSVSATEDMYLLTSEASVADPRTPGMPARRRVREFATLSQFSIQPQAAMTVIGNGVTFSGFAIEGRDHARAGDCAIAGTDRAGVATVSGATVQGYSTTITGTPTITYSADTAAVASDAGVDWSMLTDPAFPFQYELPDDGWPDFAALGSAAYPTIRMQGDLTVSGSGRGLLVVTGTLTVGTGFRWDGMVLAGDVNSSASKFDIHGALIIGLNAGSGYTTLSSPDAKVHYNSCNILDSVKGIATLEFLPSTWWEADY